MQCGSCHDSHDTVAEVRTCYAGRDPERGQQIAARLDRVGARRAVRIETVTLDEDAIWAAVIAADKLPPLPPPPDRPSPAARVPSINAFFSQFTMPEGYYAVPSRTGNNDLDFYRVDRPRKGDWAGFVFVKRIIGGHPPQRISKGEQMGALDRIQRAGWSQAAQKYSRETGQCYRCRIELTDDASRALGLGETCAGHRGLGEEWKRLDRRLACGPKS